MSHVERERRRSIRLQPQHAKAVCSTRDAGGVYNIADMSRTGVLLEGTPSVAPGTRVALRVLVPGRDPLVIRGRVMRSHHGHRATDGFAVRFCHVSPDIEDRVADLIVNEWAKCCGPRCIVAAASPHVRRELGHRLAAVGGRVSRASTPVQLIHQLEAIRETGTVVFLGVTIGSCNVAEVAPFLSHAYPEVHLVLVTISKRSEGIEIPRGIDEVIEPPWSKEQLEFMLSRVRAAGG